jgi:hypothetical protein
MRFILTILLFISQTAFATTYYFSNTGSDGAAGTSTGTAWQTMAKFNSAFSGLSVGDTVLFKRGDTWSDAAMTISRSGSAGNIIFISAYGSGAKPIITSFATVSAWTNISGNMYISTSAVSTLSSLNIVNVNGTNAAVGSYPDAGTYLTITSHSTTVSVTSTGLGGSPSYNGGTVVIRESRWNLAKHPITAHASGTITYSGGANEPTDGYGFFIINDSDAVTAQNEWYYNTSTKKLIMYSSGSPSNVQVPAYTNLVTMVGRSYITFDNLQFTGANGNCFDMSSSTNHITIQNCDIDFTGVNGINTTSSESDITISACTINHSNNNAVYTSAATTTITGCTISNSGQIAGLGGSTSEDYIGVFSIGNTSTITYNTIKNSGYNAVEFRGTTSGDASVVNYNYIDTFCNRKDDGAGIYTWNDGGSPPTFTGRTINYNTVLHAIGAAAGTDDPALLAYCIYMDDNVMGVTISRNNLGYAGESGIYLHNAHEITLTYNTNYGNRVGMTMAQDNIPSTPSPMANIVYNNNIFFARLATDEVLEVVNRTTAGVDFGTYTVNKLTRPMDEATGTNLGPIVACENGSCTTFPWTSYNVATWKTFSGEDAGSTTAGIVVTNSADEQFIYNETSSAKNFDLGATTWVDVFGVYYQCTVQLPAYTSMVLIKGGASNCSFASPDFIQNHGKVIFKN